MNARLRRLATLVVVGALAAPVVINTDGIPLSTYPMYAHTREREATFVRVVGLQSDGSEVQLPIREIADTRDPLVAQSFLNRAARTGDTEAVCEEIAARTSAAVTSVVIRLERHDVVARTRGRPSVDERTVLFICEVP